MINKIYKKIKDNIPLFILLFFGIYSLAYIKIRIPGVQNKIYLLNIGLILITIIFYFIIKRLIYSDKKIEKLFLYISLLIGGLYVFTIPILAGTDEPSHFYRAYQVSQGEFIINSKNYDLQIEKDLLDLHYRKIRENYDIKILNKKFDKTEKVLLPEKDAIETYSPLQYIPQAIAIKIGLFLNLNPIFIVILSRIFIFLTWTYISYKAIKIFPYNKFLYFLFLTAPSILSLVSTCSGDVLLLATSFLFISKVLELNKKKTHINIEDIIMLLSTSIMISISKTIYIFLIFLIFLIPKESFKKKYNRIFFIIFILSISLFTDLVWNYLASFVLKETSLSAKEQLKFILHKPITYAFIFIRTLFENSYYLMVNIFSGKEMCYSKVNIPEILSIAYVIIVILSLSKNDFKARATKEKIFFWLIFILILGSASTAMYVEWTNQVSGVGHYLIDGIQSRYFVMTVPLLLLPLKLKININSKKLFDYSMSINLSIYLCCISTLLISYLM